MTVWNAVTASGHPLCDFRAVLDIGCAVQFAESVSRSLPRVNKFPVDVLRCQHLAITSKSRCRVPALEAPWSEINRLPRTRQSCAKTIYSGFGPNPSNLVFCSTMSRVVVVVVVVVSKVQILQANQSILHPDIPYSIQETFSVGWRIGAQQEGVGSGILQDMFQLRCRMGYRKGYAGRSGHPRSQETGRVFPTRYTQMCHKRGIRRCRPRRKHIGNHTTFGKQLCKCHYIIIIIIIMSLWSFPTRHGNFVHGSGMLSHLVQKMKSRRQRFFR
mmetsp:Transcript_12698/g.29508  ORF Transcript_12698/g.29508 Transcript_12698/m.29508 type:complete len:272 (-) Transcript_12698:196-1011(-)